MSSPADCELAFEAIAYPYAQFARAQLLLLISIQILAFIPLLWKYTKKRRIPLHGNLKFLYVNLAIVYQLGPIGHFLIELRHLILGLFFWPWPCSMRTPFWYLVLSKSPTVFYLFSIPFLHFAIMLERFRATKFAKHYEAEGIRFGIAMIASIYSLVFAMVFLVLFLVFVDNGFDFFKLLPVNTITSKSANFPYQIFTLFLILLAILTAIGDVHLYRKNKKLNASNQQQSRSNSNSPSLFYNLSEKYQLHENYVAMRLILPLDLTFLIFVLISNLAVIVLRNLDLPTSLYLAHYQFISSLMTIYAIISLVIYHRFLNGFDHQKQCFGKISQKIVPGENIGRVYFEQLKNQWN